LGKKGMEIFLRTGLDRQISELRRAWQPRISGSVRSASRRWRKRLNHLRREIEDEAD
jgi:hypothetical protein